MGNNDEFDDESTRLSLRSFVRLHYYFVVGREVSTSFLFIVLCSEEYEFQ